MISSRKGYGVNTTTRGGGLRLYDVIWKDQFVEKLAFKHGVTTEEAEEVLFSQPHVRLAEKGRVEKMNICTLPTDKLQRADT